MAVMQHIWTCPHDGCLAVDVQLTLERVRPLALTTILTTLDRLCKKGILRRERVGKAYRYWATVSEEKLQQRIVEGVLSNLIDQFPKAVAAYFAHRENPETPESSGGEKLAELAQRVEAMRSIPNAGNGLDSAEEASYEETSAEETSDEERA